MANTDETEKLASTLEKTKVTEEAATAPVYDRWTLVDDATVDYGYYGKNMKHSNTENTFYLTTAINYTNGPAHMGHAYEATTSDILSRFSRLLGRADTIFVTGSDEHGQKIANTAEAKGKVPKEICDLYVIGFKCLNQRLLISNDDYIRTTSERHKRTARELWKRCHANGDVYLDTYEGWYNIREETFVTENDAALSDYKDPASGLPLKKVQEASYFFKMSQYQERLLDYIENENPDFIQPVQHKNHVLARLKSDPLRDLSISRTTFAWGISVPEGFDEKHVMYVWVDALSNYLTGVNGIGLDTDTDESADKTRFWPANVHIIGKDILWFHTVIWPCLLMSAKLPLPKCVFSHGFVNDKEGKKMSKSLGNVVDPHDILDRYPVDSFRWYLAKEAPYGGELAFSEESLGTMHNADLCDTLGNLVHRATNLTKKYCNGVVPDVNDVPISSVLPTWPALGQDYVKAFAKMEIQTAASLTMQGFRDVNGYLTEQAPWLLKGDEHALQRQRVVRTTLEAIYVLAHLLLPFVPTGGKKVFDRLNTPPKTLDEILSAYSDPKASFSSLAVGTTISIGDVLYAKLQSEEEKAKLNKKESYEEAQRRKKEKKAAEIAASKAGQAGKSDQSDFTKIEIRVGKIVKVWNHESADKLYCEQIELGEDTPREIASGLKNFYTLEEMQDRKVLVVCNLKAAKIVGFTSNGMVLAAKSEDGTKVELVSPPEDAPVGERVYIEGLEGEPFSSTQVKKKKVWEAVAKDLKTGEGGVATWSGKEIITSKGPCKVASLAGAPIS